MRIEDVTTREEMMVLHEMALLWLRYNRPLYENLKDKVMVGVGTDICSCFLRFGEEQSSLENEPRKVREGEW